jgi:hypothetical protein
MKGCEARFRSRARRPSWPPDKTGGCGPIDCCVSCGGPDATTCIAGNHYLGCVARQVTRRQSRHGCARRGGDDVPMRGGSSDTPTADRLRTVHLV